MKKGSGYWTRFGALMQTEARKTPCEKCGAAVGEPCVSSGSNPTITPHLYRHRRGWNAARDILNKEAKNGKT